MFIRLFCFGTNTVCFFFEFCFTDKYIKYVLKLIGLKIDWTLPAAVFGSIGLRKTFRVTVAFDF